MATAFPEDLKFKHKSASAKLVYLNADDYLLTDMWADHRGQGHGRVLLQKIAQYADQNGIVIILIVMQNGPVNEVPNNQVLEALYSSVGFEVSGRRPTQMIRHPSQDLHAL